MTEWIIITGEYPPQPGGVSDYTRNVARALVEAGDRVCVWAPPCAGPDPVDSGVEVRRLKSFASGQAGDPPHTFLVQYVPHAFGWKAMNIPFCLWLWSQRRRSVWVMFHEVAMPVKRGQPLSHSIIGLVNRLMARIVVRSAERIWVAIPAWEQMLRRLAPKLPPVEWLPVPSGIPVILHPPANHTGLLLGHFGTYGPAIAAMLREIIPATLRQLPNATMLLLGIGSREFARELSQHHPELAARLQATGGLSPEDASRHLSACDLMIQPYPDGVTSRRTSITAALAHGKAVVTTSGPLTEPFWHSSTAVILASASDLPGIVAALAADPDMRERMGAEALALYDSRFDLRHTIAALRGAALRAPKAVEAECASRS